MSLIPKQVTSYPIPPFEELTLLLFAKPGMGKTKFASGCPGTMFIGTEPGQEFTKSAVVQCWNWTTFKQIIDEVTDKRIQIKAGKLPLEECPYTSFTIDIIDNLSAFCRDYVCSQRGLAYPPANDFGKTWSAITAEWKRELTRLMVLGPVRFISHCNAVSTEVEDANGMKVEIDQQTPTFAGSKAAQFLDGIVNAMGYIYVSKEGHHCITFRKTAGVGAKDRTDVLAGLGIIDIDWSLGKNPWQIVSEEYKKRAEENGLIVQSKKKGGSK